MINLAQRTIEYSFCLLFFLVPLVFTSGNYELFEFNKMLLVYAMIVVIVGAWIIKMFEARRLIFQRTPLDIPLLLFLAANIISTVFSLDTHTSLFGYYSRFNGGLLSIISYVLLYYALVSNLQEVKKLLLVALFSGLLVSLWGIPSHFGYDPTCFLLTGELNATCWRADFNPTLRIFSTLGQPNWLAAYLAMLLPLGLAFYLNYQRKKLLSFLFYLLSSLFYLALLFTSSRAGILGFAAGLVVFLALLGFKTLKQNFKPLLLLAFCFLFLTIFFGGFLFERFTPLTRNLPFLQRPPQVGTPAGQSPSVTALETGGTESGSIRQIVWQGAIDIFRHYPIFGSGVETFAYSYYLYRPQAHNLTTEWDFLYNKAHNEYLNYLATTGLFGFGAYLAIILVFIGWTVKRIRNYELGIRVIIVSLLAGYVVYLIQNFFGFSVVPVALFFYLFPAIAFVLGRNEGAKSSFALSLFERGEKRAKISTENLRTLRAGSPQANASWIAPESDERLTRNFGRVVFQIGKLVIILLCFFFLFLILQIWRADMMFSRGYSLTRAGYSWEARNELKSAITVLPYNEPFYYSELGLVTAILASQGETLEALQASEATDATQKALQISPANLNYQKTASRTYFELSILDPTYKTAALTSAKTAVKLAPTEPRIRYNLALLYGKLGEPQKAIATLKEVIILKPNYRDAHYALALFYKDAGQKEEAVKELNEVLKIVPGDSEAVEKLENWTK